MRFAIWKIAARAAGTGYSKDTRYRGAGTGQFWNVRRVVSPDSVTVRKKLELDDTTLRKLRQIADLRRETHEEFFTRHLREGNKPSGQLE